MTLHKNVEDDEYFLQLDKNDLEKEFIYFAYVLNAPQAAGVRGGAIGQGAVLEFRRFKDEIALFKKNTNFQTRLIITLEKPT